LVPEIVDLRLGIATDRHRDRLTELELRATVERREFLPGELEDDDQHCALGLVPSLVVAREAEDPRIPEDRDVVLRRLLGLVVEPQAGGDLLDRRHWLLL